LPAALSRRTDKPWRGLPRTPPLCIRAATGWGSVLHATARLRGEAPGQSTVCPFALWQALPWTPASSRTGLGSALDSACGGGRWLQSHVGQQQALLTACLQLQHAAAEVCPWGRLQRSEVAYAKRPELNRGGHRRPRECPASGTAQKITFSDSRAPVPQARRRICAAAGSLKASEAFAALAAAMAVAVA